MGSYGSASSPRTSSVPPGRNNSVPGSMPRPTAGVASGKPPPAPRSPEGDPATGHHSAAPPGRARAPGFQFGEGKASSSSSAPGVCGGGPEAQVSATLAAAQANGP